MEPALKIIHDQELEPELAYWLEPELALPKPELALLKPELALLEPKFTLLELEPPLLEPELVINTEFWSYFIIFSPILLFLA